MFGAEMMLHIQVWTNICQLWSSGQLWKFVREVDPWRRPEIDAAMGAPSPAWPALHKSAICSRTTIQSPGTKFSRIGRTKSPDSGRVWAIRGRIGADSGRFRLTSSALGALGHFRAIYSGHLGQTCSSQKATPVALVVVPMLPPLGLQTSAKRHPGSTSSEAAIELTAQIVPKICADAVTCLFGVRRKLRRIPRILLNTCSPQHWPQDCSTLPPKSRPLPAQIAPLLTTCRSLGKDRPAKIGRHVGGHRHVADLCQVSTRNGQHCWRISAGRRTRKPYPRVNSEEAPCAGRPDSAKVGRCGSDLG